ncbi:MAG: hypothetical protein ACR2K6_04000 [Solirubrobacterales bacterium]
MSSSLELVANGDPVTVERFPDPSEVVTLDELMANPSLGKRLGL